MLDPYEVMSEALGCLCEQVAQTPAGTPCFCGLLPGSAIIPLDACACGQGNTDCGTAWVRLDSMFPSTAFPTPDTRGQRCGGPLAYRIHVGVMRCVPGLDEAGNPPTAAQQLRAVEQMTADQMASLKAVQCCMGKAKSGRTMFVGAWQPLGAPDGHCTGGVWPVTIWEVGW